MIKKAESIPIKKILGQDDNSNELYYKIPPYQREYTWGKDHWENFFNDINENEEKGYFLGSIICIKKDDFSEVIDGQQRLTTISILLNAVLNIINTYNKDNPNRKILDFIENENNVLIYGELKKLIYLKKQKLEPSKQNLNDVDYKYLLSINNLIDNIEKPSNFGNRRISKAYEYFKTRLLEVDDEKNIFKIEDVFLFLEKVLSALIVKIDVDDIASAFTLFESINNRGIPLTPIDLIKNSIIGKMHKDLGEEAEKTNDKWQTIVKNIENYDDQVRFLRHYYHAYQHKEKIKIPSFIKATKSNIIKIYSSHIKQDVEFIFNELIEKSKIYNLFVHPENIEEDKYLVYQNKLIDLKRLGVAPSYSLLLYLFQENISNIEDILNIIENWFMRRNITDFPGTNKLDQIFLDLINIIINENNDNIYMKIVEFLTTPERYKSDDEFQDFLENKDIYTENTNATRCLLTKLEKSNRTKENEVNFWKLSNKGKLIWSIEHILPQTPNDKTNWLNIFTREEHEKNVHKLGNLTLTCYNSTLSNKDFNDKSSIVEDNKDIGLKSGNVFINDYLKDKEEWNKGNIIERGKLLSSDIIDLLKIKE